MNQIIFLKPHLENVPESPRSIDINELVYISRISNNSMEVEEIDTRPRRLSDLRIPQAQHEPLSFTVNLSMTQQDTTRSWANTINVSSSSNQKIFNLSSRKLSRLNEKLPYNLIILNISHNQFSHIPNLDNFGLLEHLDIS